MRNKLFDPIYGLQRVDDPDARARGEVGYWLTDEARQLTHGYLTPDPQNARRWESEAGPYKFLKRNARLRSRLKVRPIPGAMRTAV